VVQLPEYVLLLFFFFFFVFQVFFLQGSPHSVTRAAACYDGTCEAKAITSVLHVSIPGLNGNVQLKINGLDEWSAFNNQTGDINYCVFNLVFTEVHVTFRAGQTVSVTNINCETVNQRCEAGLFTSTICPDFGCLNNSPFGPPSVQYVIYSEQFGIVYSATGAPSGVLQCVTVPAFPNLAVEVIEGTSCPTTYSCLSCAQTQTAVSCGAQVGACAADSTCLACLTGASIFTPACQVQDNAALNALKACQQSVCPTCVSVQNPFSGGCVRWNIPATDCSYIADSGVQTQCTTNPAYGSFGRTLSAFELFFLPTGVTVKLATPDGVPYRVINNQGGSPRCYCILPSYTSVFLNEGPSTWGSTPQNCVPQLTPPAGTAAYDCSVCDFLVGFFFFFVIV
jgi:hypothetical protein